jgi:hypothetical protein
MPRTLLIQSRDPFESADVAADGLLAADLTGRGDAVSVLLVQNAVLAARRRARAAWLDQLEAAGVPVLADSFSLRERAIPAGDLRAGVRAAELDVALDALLAGDRVLWP